MTHAETNAIIIAVPLGTEHAAGSREIASALNQALGTIQQRLNALALEGVIKRRTEPTSSGFKWLYWREDVAMPVTTQAPSTVLGAG